MILNTIEQTNRFETDAEISREFSRASPVGVAVSVVIPFYRGVEWLCEAVESVLRQTLPVQEIIVVNDGSPEDVSGFLRKYGSSIVYREKANGGPAAARNTGIEIAVGDYVAFLDSDDLWMPDKNEKQLSAMERCGASWSHTGYELFDTESAAYETVRTVSIGDFDGKLFPRMMYSNPLATPSVMVRASLLREDRDLRFGEGMRYGQDQYLWMRLALGRPILAIDEPLVKVRMRGKNASLRARAQIKAKALLYERLSSFAPDRSAELSSSARFGFRWCAVGEGLLDRFDSGHTARDNVIEWMSRFFYVVPWLLFKFNAYCSRRKTL